ncbi:MAG: DegT/DnrJ/EryC1/StrS family aminotransferase [bacterium]|nr:DegT/DnrJ/EryC1/StrS family aminotransferase [bacterium]
MIPVNEPLIREKELEYITECIKTGWISSQGRFIEEFEEKFSKYIGTKHGVAVSNGTVALQLALRALNLEPGSEIIIPTFTIISCALACIYNNLKPVLVDSEPDTWNMDVSQIEGKITPKTKAIMPVHIYGHPVDMDAVVKIAKKYDLYIVEDAAEVHGAEYRSQNSEVRGQKAGGERIEWRKAGSFGDISCFSFYANKIITTGEGGMVLTNDDKLADRLKRLRNLAFLQKKRFYHKELGFNFRMTNLQAAIGVAQMERIDEHVQIKRRNAKLYTQLLTDTPYLQLPTEKPWAKNVYWMYGIVVDESTGYDGEQFTKSLAEKGITTRPFFYPIHLQPVFKDMGLYEGESYPVAERIARQGLYLPSGLTLTEEQIEKVAIVVKTIMSERKCL